MSRHTVIAVDLGAESGRVMAVHYDGKRFDLEELHRFLNPVTEVHGTLYWDILHLWRNIQEGIEKGKQYNPLSIGVDTWAIDFVLLDEQGNLLSNPVMYRDSRTDGMMEISFAKVPKREIFAQTGIQFMQINTLYQMMSLVESKSPLLKTAKTFLTIPDLLNYWLTGEKVWRIYERKHNADVQSHNRDMGNGDVTAIGYPDTYLPRKSFNRERRLVSMTVFL